MSALTERIAAEHEDLRYGCSCEIGRGEWLGDSYGVHVAEVTEAAVREEVAREIESVDGVEWALAGQHAGTDAARIARGES